MTMAMIQATKLKNLSKSVVQYERFYKKRRKEPQMTYHNYILYSIVMNTTYFRHFKNNFIYSECIRGSVTDFSMEQTFPLEI